MTSEDKTGLDVEEHGATLIVRINGGEHALLDPGMAAQLGRLVDRADKDPASTPSCSREPIPIDS